jgi:hypothetical protein
MKINHGHQYVPQSILSRPTIDVRDIIYDRTSSDCVSVCPGVANGDQDEPQSIISRPTVDVQYIIYGITSSECVSLCPGVANGDQDEPQDEIESVLDIYKKVEGKIHP